MNADIWTAVLPKDTTDQTKLKQLKHASSHGHLKDFLETMNLQKSNADS